MAQLSLSLLTHRLQVTTVPTGSARASLLAHLAHTQSMGGALATCAQQAPTALKPKAPSINVNQANTPSKDGPPVKLVQPATLVVRMVYCLHVPLSVCLSCLQAAQVTGTDALGGVLTRVLQELLASEDVLGAQLCVLKDGEPIVDLCAGVKGVSHITPIIYQLPCNSKTNSLRNPDNFLIDSNSKSV